MKIYLVRHAVSHLNAGLMKHHDMPNHLIPIVDPEGVNQALNVGEYFGADFLIDAQLYCSPYLRTRQTMENIVRGAGLRLHDVNVYEDSRLRETDFGYGNYEEQKAKREREGHFWYRFDGGESSADCFDRMSSFIGSMMRQSDRARITLPSSTPFGGGHNVRRNVIIVSHGTIIRSFVMRFLHLTVEQFDSIDTPDNCSIVTIGPSLYTKNPQFTCGNWAVEGLKFR